MPTPIAVTLSALVGVLLLAAAVVTLVWPVLAAYAKALIRRDRGWAFVPHSRRIRTRIAATFYVLVGVTLLVAFQPRPFLLPAHPLPPPTGSPPHPLVDAEVIPLIESGSSLAMVVGVVDPTGRRVWGYGATRIGGGAPDGGTIFEIGSLTQPFTSLLLVRLIEAGSLGFDQPVRELLPDSVSVPAFGLDPILVEHLATHRAALPSVPPGLGTSLLDACPPFADPWSGYTAEKLYRFLSSYEPERPPGERVENSDLGMGLLGHAMERAAAAGFDTLMRREVAEPLGLSSTGVRLDQARRKRLAPGTVTGWGAYRGWRLASPAHEWRYRAMAGAGGLRSSADDLLTFLAAHLRLEPSPFQDAMDFTRQPHYRGGARDAVGLGWRIRLAEGAEEAMVWQGGATGGHRSWAGMIEARGIGVVVLSNSATDVNGIGERILRGLAAGR